MDTTARPRVGHGREFRSRLAMRHEHRISLSPLHLLMLLLSSLLAIYILHNLIFLSTRAASQSGPDKVASDPSASSSSLRLQHLSSPSSVQCTEPRFGDTLLQPLSSFVNRSLAPPVTSQRLLGYQEFHRLAMANRGADTQYLLWRVDLYQGSLS